MGFVSRTTSLVVLLLLLCVSALGFSPFFRHRRFLIPNMGQASSTPAATSSLPVCLVVTVEIKEDRVPEFLQVIEQDAIGSRTKENGGCLRFDVLRCKDKANTFIFYEVYTNDDAVAFHKDSPHFALWTNFKASGGVVSQAVEKCEGLFL